MADRFFRSSRLMSSFGMPIMLAGRIELQQAIRAFKTTQGLTITDNLYGTARNGVLSIAFTDFTPAVAATLTEQDLTFDAATAGAAGNSITIEYEDFTPAVAASLVEQDLTYTAVTAGSAGNSITIDYDSDGTAGAETVGVIGSAILVHMDATPVTGSTATQIKAAIDGTPAAAALVSVVVSGTGSNVQSAISATPLANGANAIGDAGNEVVTVVSDAIKIKFESGVSTATQIKAKFDASGPAIALASCTISGTAGDAQTAPFGPTALANGADAIGDAGNEVVTVVGNAISVKLESGVSTVTQVRTALMAASDFTDIATATGTSSATVSTAGALSTAGAQDAVKSFSISGVTNIVQEGTGEFTITMLDSFASCPFAKFMMEASTAVDLIPQLSSVDAVGKSISVQLLTGGTVSAPSASCFLHMLLMFNNSSFS